MLNSLSRSISRVSGISLLDSMSLDSRGIVVVGNRDLLDTVKEYRAERIEMNFVAFEVTFNFGICNQGEIGIW